MICIFYDKSVPNSIMKKRFVIQWIVKKCCCVAMLPDADQWKWPRPASGTTTYTPATFYPPRLAIGGTWFSGSSDQAGMLWLDGRCGSSGNVLGVGAQAHVEQQSVALNPLTSQDFQALLVRVILSHKYWSGFSTSLFLYATRHLKCLCGLRKLRIGKSSVSSCDQLLVGAGDS